MSALRSTIQDVEKTLTCVRAAKDPKEAPVHYTSKSADGVSFSTSEEKAFPEVMSMSAMADAAPVTVSTPDQLKAAMSASKENGLGGQVETMENMAVAIEPIIQKFDSVLVSTLSEATSISRPLITSTPE